MVITAIIVTYTDRFSMLIQVIEACFTSNVSRIIIVDHNSSKNSKEQLKVIQYGKKNKFVNF